MFKVGDLVTIHPKGYDQMQGTLERVIKFDKPFGKEVDDQTQWTAHIQVSGNHPRNSGTFVIPYIELKGGLK